MKPSLTKRLEALEAATPPKDDAEQRARFSLTCSALDAAYSHKRPWARSELAPYHLEEQPSPLELLWGRLQAGTATDADRAALASLPPCNFTPEELVEALADLNDSF